MTTTPAGEREPGQELCGLAGPEAERRLAEHGRSEAAEVRSAPLHSRVLAQLRDPLIMVLLGAALLTIVIGDHPDAVVTGLVIVFNTTVGVAQEIRPTTPWRPCRRCRHQAPASCVTAPHGRLPQLLWCPAT
ncbi:cation-transporting P-type ATPase [Streptomyces sp. NPDC058092]|uniref:cation-transporting P-type ATPase n=1 Tax=Streptomyces sp. NPDC058092 TaxID=3346336 RepID=UPI0036E33158